METITEFDEAGLLRATYVKSGQTHSTRVDIINPLQAKTSWGSLVDVFLPAGYPQSVTEDYLEYQVFDSLQAFSSSIAGLLASRAVLEGVGVGDATASATAAVLLTIVQESMGRVATILFAHRLGTSLEPECKMYRLLADFLNDAAMILDCLSPAFPKPLRIVVLSCSSTLRALCGVAAGSAKASLSAHFARWGNLGELNAKDSSQETVISLMGMLVGGVIVPYITTAFATWSTLLCLLALHLYLNYAAVRAVSMQSLNRQRTCILVSNLIDERTVLTPAEVSKKERIFAKGSVLRWNSRPSLGTCCIGVELKTLLSDLGTRSGSTGSIADLEELPKLLTLFRKDQYLLWHDVDTQRSKIVLKQEAKPLDHIKAWTHALLLARELSHYSRTSAAGKTSVVTALTSTHDQTARLFTEHLAAIERAGWDISIPHMETRSGSRIFSQEDRT